VAIKAETRKESNTVKLARGQPVSYIQAVEITPMTLPIVEQPVAIKETNTLSAPLPEVIEKSRKVRDVDTKISKQTSNKQIVTSSNKRSSKAGRRVCW
jgi:hypothetical protein